MKRTARIFWAAMALVSALMVRTMYMQNSLDCELIYAIKRLDGPAVKTCLAKGANPNATDPETRGPLLWRALAHLTGQSNVARDGQAALLVVFDSCSKLAQTASVSRQTGVLALSSLEPTEIVSALLGKGANANLQVGQGEGPIACAQWLGYNKCVHLLLEHGARTDEVAVDGGTLLTCAIRHDNLDTIFELVKHGADVNLPEKSGASPLTIARLIGDERITQFLIEAGAHK